MKQRACSSSTATDPRDAATHPCQFLPRLLPEIKANLHPKAHAISLIKVRATRMALRGYIECPSELVPAA